MRTVIIFAILGSTFLGCASNRYTYKIKLEQPYSSDKLLFENDTMSVSFEFEPKFISFKIFNKSEEGIRINWDELSMSINGKAQRVVHKETGTTKITDLQPPTTIPPKTILEDALLPTDKINYTNNQGRLTPILADIYPVYDYGNKKTRQKIMSMKGQRITIFFPYYIRNVFHSKVFNFIIEDITVKRG
jgi:hypothetical protein